MDKLFSKAALAARFEVTPRTIDNWTARGLLPPPIKLGTAQQSRVRWTDDAVRVLEQRLRSGAGVNRQHHNAA